jgi:hypothetical protein
MKYIYVDIIYYIIYYNYYIIYAIFDNAYNNKLIIY